MDDNQKRRFFQKIKQLTHEKFWSVMNIYHTRAYAAAERHYGEAMDIVLTKKQKEAVVAKAIQIREEWDGMMTVTTDETENEIFDIRTR
ncbi:hypothetical protein [Paenibacillus oryzisoli]|uniref:Uncharacterized protein n=1 Tax=Paenibacillus oryzisoli TaxID=1850517 RepID=A0A198AI22_9BACL|nr:hypothetical protein [Paenibacillus oryzisoli]OAS21154.1 hypothetical protein A8708_30145 [Paenibacillus oryzisoli]